MKRLAPSTRWAFISIGAFLFVSTLVETERRIGSSPLPIMLVLAAVFVVVLAMGAFRFPVERPPRLMFTTTAAFTLLMLYAFVSTLMTEQRIGEAGTELVTLSKAWSLSVPVQALSVCLMAFFAVVLVRRRDLTYVLWWFAMAGAVLTPIGWLLKDGELGGRLANRVGGAAVLHVALLLGLAVSLAAWRSRYRTRLSLAASGLYVLYILLSQSRAGIIGLLVFSGLLFGPPLVRHIRTRGFSRQILIAAGVAVVVIGVMGAFVADRWRADPLGGGRMNAWLSGWEAATSSVVMMIFGTGFGTLWPWYAFEQGGYQPERGAAKAMPHDPETLAHVHNVYVYIGAELGIVGLLLLVPVIIAILWCYRTASTRQSRALAAALLATLVSFLFDTYLIKNFPLSLIWWCAFFTLIRLTQHGLRAPRAAALA